MLLLALACGSSGANDDNSEGQAGGGQPSAGSGAVPAGGGGQNGGSGNGNGESGASGASGEASGACDEYAIRSCERAMACLPDKFMLRYASLDDCANVAKAECVEQLAAPGSGQSSEALAECAAQLEAQSCAEWFVSSAAECTPAGQLANDASCRFGSQCASGFCAVAAGAWCGACKPRPALGKACRPDLRECEPGLLCAYKCPNGSSCAAAQRDWLCAAPIAEGQPCAFSIECQGDLMCSGGKCIAGEPVGAACSNDSGGAQCDFLANLVCIGEVGAATCQKNSYAALGAACDVSRAMHCAANGACIDAAGNYVSDGPGTCGPPVKSGETCNASRRCAAPDECQGEVCTPPPATCP